MTQRDALHCIHEPFGDAFYYGPERLSSRYENDEKARLDSGFAQSTFRTVLDRIEKEGAEVRNTPSSVASFSAAPFFVAQYCKEMWCFHTAILEFFGNPFILNIHASAAVFAALSWDLSLVRDNSGSASFYYLTRLHSLFLNYAFFSSRDTQPSCDGKITHLLLGPSSTHFDYDILTLK